MSIDNTIKGTHGYLPKRYQVEVDGEVIHRTDDEQEAIQFMDEDSIKAQADVNAAGVSFFYQVIDNESAGKNCVVATSVVRPEPSRKPYVNERSVFQRVFSPKKERA